jgi:hypothetical protein
MMARTSDRPWPGWDGATTPRRAVETAKATIGAHDRTVVEVTGEPSRRRETV